VSTPFVLLHALAVPSGMWDAPRAALAADGHDVVAFDQRGYGGVPLGDAEPSLGVVADDLARELDAGGHDKAVVAGCSMGGYVALEFARRHPGRLAGLALLSTRAVADAPDVAAGRLQFAEAILDAGRRDRLIAATVPALLSPEFARHHPEVSEWLRTAVERVPPAAIAWSQRAIAGRTGALDVLAELAVPALVVHGTADALTSAEDARLMADALPRADPRSIDGAGHLLPLEAPDTVTAALRGLLAEIVAVAR
jgi:pimeloyl-ACP methyl ester carboxylesterase